MKIMVDTNVLFSTLLFPESRPARVLLHIDVLMAKLSYELISAPLEPGKLISDPGDHPILNAAIISDVDIIISGDRHFLDLKMEHPKTMSVSDFLDGESMNVSKQ
jgi:uncharacterized protein